ncbi:MAG TPA: choice-of-anchor D domain-containing protein, partial [Terriglobia bacterium]|nr:choice-of-anchor D domain-containing protein [Terriglobia bacterium]
LGEGACSTPCSNAFVTVLNPLGNGLVYSTYLGGFGPDYGQAVAVDSSGNAYVAGSTASANFPAVSGAFQPAYGSTGISGNGFVAKVSPANAPSVAITPQKIDFGNQGQGAASATKTVTVTNAGSAPLAISGITSSSADFAQTNTCGASLAAGGAQCTITITFTPSSASAETGNLAIADNAAGSPQQVSLSGTGTTPTPVATFSPSVLTFGSQLVGTTSAPQTVTLTNAGSADLTITKVTISGAYAETDNCPGTLAPSKSCAIQVTFSPTATTSSSSSSSTTTASNSGALSLTDNEKTPPVVNLNGTAAADFSLSSTGPSTIPLIGTTSVTIKISLASLLSSFADQVSFSCSSGVACSFDPASISTGQTTTATVSGISGSSNPLTFTVTGTNTGTNAGTQAAAANVSVSFEDYALAAAPSLANVSAGQPATYTVTLAPVSGFNNPVSLSCSSGLPTGASCSFSPASITSNGSSPVSSTVTITTTAHLKSVAGPPPGNGAPPPGTPLGGAMRDAILLALALGLVVAVRLRWRKQPWLLLGMVLVFALLVGGCNLGYYGFIGSNPAPTGSPAGVYTVVISGTYTPAASTTGQTPVSRSTSVNLAVQ